MWLLGEIHIYQSLWDSILSGQAVLGTFTVGVWAQWNLLTFQGKLKVQPWQSNPAACDSYSSDFCRWAHLEKCNGFHMQKTQLGYRRLMCGRACFVHYSGKKQGRKWLRCPLKASLCRHVFVHPFLVISCELPSSTWPASWKGRPQVLTEGRQASWCEI